MQANGTPQLRAAVPFYSRASTSEFQSSNCQQADHFEC